MTWEQAASAWADAQEVAVWRVLADGPRWADWHAGVEWMWVETVLQPGALVTIKPRRIRQTAFVVEEALAERRLVLRLTFGPLAALRLSWTLAAAEGRTRIDGGVTITGPAAGLLLKKTAVRLASALPADLERLARRAAGPK